MEDVQLMRRIIGSDMGVKASGGIRTYEDAMKMIAAGANRIGTSGGPAMVSPPQDNTTDKGKNDELTF